MHSGSMDWASRNQLANLLRLKRKYGDLNSALVMLYFQTHPGNHKISTAAKYLDVSRSMVRRAISRVSEKDS